ncbi:low affinity immunoglobulin gamma Fc region receptor III-A-like isoform X2 [Oncorhynchus keta]|uniref:low affinity immunoglobulin gamma Fc region receptor III-A-like isoform X2 n=1 Tax=Oncorhynchus keta TaxID=8018 RepID=UPI0015FC680C|nr:low affinity immunoglobulin gamma Fc region receptor III-A-like isoform X2 [Oncorhynchus keta]
MEHTLFCLLLLLSTHIYSGHSEDDDGRAMAVLTKHPKSSQIFSGESVTLRCNIQRGKVTDWKYTWSKDGVDFLSREHKYEISDVKISNSGDYWCLGTHIGNGTHSRWSDAVRLTVTALPTASVKMVTTQETLHSGDTVKLQCDISKYTDWTYHWLINKERLSSQTSKTTTILLSYQGGQYQCQGTRTRRPQHSYFSSSLNISVTSVTPGPSTSVLVGVVVGLVVAGVLLAILLVLLCRCKKAQDSCCNRIFSPHQLQRTNLDPQQDQGSTQGQAADAGYTHLQHGGANIYDTITPSNSNDNEMPADPKENPVYSEIKAWKTTATGPVDVTYAEVDLKQKAKAKKKKETATPPEADSVYYQLKPGTAPGT